MTLSQNGDSKTHPGQDLRYLFSTCDKTLLGRDILLPLGCQVIREGRVPQVRGGWTRGGNRERGLHQSHSLVQLFSWGGLSWQQAFGHTIIIIYQME